MAIKNIFSLFSGCGGMDVGFHGGFDVPEASIFHKSWIDCKLDYQRVRLKENPYHMVFANDIKSSAKSAWTTYFSKHGYTNLNDTFYLGSIVDYIKNIETKNIDFSGASIDIVVGGFPCQDFSISGKRKGFNSHKSHTGKLLSQYDKPAVENRGVLYIWMQKIIEIVRPKLFIAENVKGLVSLANVKTIIEEDFKNIGNGGYLVLPAQVLQAADYGVPQNRERVFFIGFDRSQLTPEAIEALSSSRIPQKYTPYPSPTHAQELSLFNHTQGFLPYVTTREALQGLPEPSYSSDVCQQKYSKAKWYGRHCQGQIEIDLDGISPTIRSEHHGNIEYRRLAQIHGGKNILELQQGLEERRLTVRECARIQTFPDDFEFIINDSRKEFRVSVSEAYKLIGNAVPPLLGYHFARRLDEIWDLIFKN